MSASGQETPKALVEVSGSSHADLTDAIHTLAQPLTSLSFLLDFACLRSEPDVWLQTLQSAREECRRAVSALWQLRVAALAAGLLQPEIGSNTCSGQIP